jgi:cysteine synthase B
VKNPAYAEFQGLLADTPMRRLRKLCPRDDVELWAKLEGTNLGGSVKDRAALGMITAAEEAGLLSGGKPLVEATSGNTGIALAMIAALKKIPITLLMPTSATPERRAIMKAHGAEVVLVDEGMEAARDLAQAMHDAGTHVQLNQFANPANPQMHYETTGPEVWNDTAGKVTHFVSSMGTTGTIMGTSRYLKERNPAVQIVGVQPEDGSKIPGIRRWPEAYLPKIFEPERVDRTIDVSEAEAGRTTRALAQDEGLFVGLSSGGACAAALQVAAEAPAGSVIVFIVCDRGDKYLSMPELFPA